MQENTVATPACGTFPTSLFNSFKGRQTDVPLVNKMPQLNYLYWFYMHRKHAASFLLGNHSFIIQTFLIFQSPLGNSGNLGLKSSTFFLSLCRTKPIPCWRMTSLRPVIPELSPWQCSWGQSRHSSLQLWGWCRINLSGLPHSLQACQQQDTKEITSSLICCSYYFRAL